MWVFLVMPRFAAICLTALLAVLTYLLGGMWSPIDKTPSCCRSGGSRLCRRVEQSLMGLIYAQNNSCCTCLGLAGASLVQSFKPALAMWPQGSQQAPQEALLHLAHSRLSSLPAAWEACSLPGAGSGQGLTRAGAWVDELAGHHVMCTLRKRPPIICSTAMPGSRLSDQGASARSSIHIRAGARPGTQKAPCSLYACLSQPGV